MHYAIYGYNTELYLLSERRIWTLLARSFLFLIGNVVDRQLKLVGSAVVLIEQNTKNANK
jgi:hypothetical protein